MLKNIPADRYSSYKDSGVEWLGEIPNSWSLTRLGTRFEERKTKVSDKDFPPLSVTKNGTIPQLDSAAKSNDGDNRKLVKTGDFVINSRSDRKGSSGIAYQDGSVSLIYIVIEPKGINPAYCNYLLKSYNFIEEFYRMGHGIVADLWTTRYDEMKAIMVGIPTIEEQTAIAAFLDRKTALLDQAIDIKQKQIELLKERRQILIHKAVTRGLNPDVKMKDSGVEWIGEIPEHWEVKRLKYFFNEKKSKFIDGDWIESKDINGEDYRYLTTGNIGEGFYKEQGEGFISSKTFKKLNCTEAISGDLLICRLSLPLGRTCICPKLNHPLVLSVDVVIARMDSLYNRRFYNYLMNTNKYQEHTELVSRGSIMSRISRNILGNIFFQIPNFQEQMDIVKHLDNQTEKINNIISLKEKEIEKLKEYKTTLINSAVTGKIKVYNDAK